MTTTPSIPVFCVGRLVGFLSYGLENWNSMKNGETPKLHRFARGSGGPNAAAIPVTMRTVFDSLQRAIALEVEDVTPLEAWPEFRFLGERPFKVAVDRV